MAVDERARRALYDQLELAMGIDAATTLIEYLPPVGWADVATKRDLDALEGRVDSRFSVLEGRVDNRFDRLDGSIDSRFDSVDSRFDVLEGRVDSRFDVLEGSIDSRFEIVDSRFEQLGSRIGEEMANVTATLRGEISVALHAQTRLIIFALLGQALAYTGGIVAVAHFL